MQFFFFLWKLKERADSFWCLLLQVVFNFRAVIDLFLSVAQSSGVPQTQDVCAMGLQAPLLEQVYYIEVRGGLSHGALLAVVADFYF